MLALPKLPYSYDSLKDFGMGEETMKYHHGHHHKAYVDNGNKLLEASNLENKSIEELIIDNYNPNSISQNGLFNNIAQHWNHCEFWKMMSPKKQYIPGELEKSLNESFGSIESFREEFVAAGTSQFGSGWCWLVKDENDKLLITKTENGVNPLCFSQTALLGCDVWEHAYYLDFRNKRPAYIINFLENLTNWEYVASKL